MVIASHKPSLNLQESPVIYQIFSSEQDENSRQFMDDPIESNIMF